jgi:DNA polymerase III epsilon subunit family exonuclease
VNNKHYIIVDIETTWLSKDSNHITEIAAVLFDGKKIVKKFQTLVNPQRPIPSFITHLTGINNEMVKNAPTIDQALQAFLAFLEDHIFVAHNATFDHWFLNHNGVKHLNSTIENHVLCTRKLANRLLPDLPSKRLEALCRHFNVTNKRAHRAMADVLATVEIFQKMLILLKKKGIEDKAEIIQFQNYALYKCR